MNLHRVAIPRAKQLTKAAIQANTNILFVGPPGVGKTAIMREVANEVDLPLVSVLGSSLDPTDIGGFPVVRESGQFDRIPMAKIRRCADEPCLLFLDEVSCVSKPVLATMLQLVHDRVAGDVTLHKDTRIVGACNPPEQAPGAAELEAAFLGRWAVFEFYPTIAPAAGAQGDVFQWFYATLGAEKHEKHDVGRWARDFAAVLSYRPDLVQLDPPQASITDGDPWGSPRAWERGLRNVAALESALPGDDEAIFAGLAGSVGSQLAASFLGTMKLRQHLPRIGEITASPKTCVVPQATAHQVGALALLLEVARFDVWAAWIYTARLNDEVKQAAARMLNQADCKAGPSPHAEAGARARTFIFGEITHTVYGQ